MVIRCPHCQFSRSITLDKIPATAEVATCPKCNQRFQFRTIAKKDLPEPQARPQDSSEHRDNSAFNNESGQHYPNQHSGQHPSEQHHSHENFRNAPYDEQADSPHSFQNNRSSHDHQAPLAEELSQSKSTTKRKTKSSAPKKDIWDTLSSLGKLWEKEKKGETTQQETTDSPSLPADETHAPSQAEQVPYQKSRPQAPATPVYTPAEEDATDLEPSAAYLQPTENTELLTSSLSPKGASAKNKVSPQPPKDDKDVEIHIRYMDGKPASFRNPWAKKQDPQAPEELPSEKLSHNEGFFEDMTVSDHPSNFSSESDARQSHFSPEAPDVSSDASFDSATHSEAGAMSQQDDTSPQRNTNEHIQEHHPHAENLRELEAHPPARHRAPHGKSPRKEKAERPLTPLETLAAEGLQEKTTSVPLTRKDDEHDTIPTAANAPSSAHAQINWQEDTATTGNGITPPFTGDAHEENTGGTALPWANTDAQTAHIDVQASSEQGGPSKALTFTASEIAGSGDGAVRPPHDQHSLETATDANQRTGMTDEFQSGGTSQNAMTPDTPDVPMAESSLEPTLNPAAQSTKETCESDENRVKQPSASPSNQDLVPHETPSLQPDISSLVKANKPFDYGDTTPEERVEKDLCFLQTDTERPTKELGILREVQSENILSPFSETREIPWEHPQTYGVFSSLLRTIKNVMFSAPAFFRTMPPMGGMAFAFLFFILHSYLAVMCTTFWIILAAILFDIPSLSHVQDAVPMVALFTPVALSLLLIAVTSCTRIFLILFQRQQASFAFTFKLLCYSIAPLLLSIIPFIGPIAGLIWSFIILATACHHSTGLSPIRSVITIIPTCFLTLWLLFLLLM